MDWSQVVLLVLTTSSVLSSAKSELSPTSSLISNSKLLTDTLDILNIRIDADNFALIYDKSFALEIEHLKPTLLVNSRNKLIFIDTKVDSYTEHLIENSKNVAKVRKFVICVSRQSILKRIFELQQVRRIFTDSSRHQLFWLLISKRRVSLKEIVEFEAFTKLKRKKYSMASDFLIVQPNQYTKKQYTMTVQHHRNFKWISSDLAVWPEIQVTTERQANNWQMIGQSSNNSSFELDFEKAALFSASQSSMQTSANELQERKPRKHLVITAIEAAPFMMHTVDENGTHLWQGYCMDFFQELTKHLPYELTWEIYNAPDNRFGAKATQVVVDRANASQRKVENWNGIIGELSKGRADMALAPLAVMAERELVVDFTVPYYDLVGIQILLKKPEVPQEWFKFLTVLDNEVWLFIGVAYFFTSFVMFVFDRLSPYSHKNKARIERIKQKIEAEHGGVSSRHLLSNASHNNQVNVPFSHRFENMKQFYESAKLVDGMIFKKRAALDYQHFIGGGSGRHLSQSHNLYAGSLATGFGSQSEGIHKIRPVNIAATDASHLSGSPTSNTINLFKLEDELEAQGPEQQEPNADPSGRRRSSAFSLYIRSLKHRQHNHVHRRRRHSNQNQNQHQHHHYNQNQAGTSGNHSFSSYSRNEYAADSDDNRRSNSNSSESSSDFDDGKPDFGFRDSLWFCITSLTPQGGGEAPQNLSGRIVAGAWWIFCFIVLASYTANLAAFLTVSRLDIPIDSLDDLGKQYRIKYSPADGTAEQTYFERMAYIEEVFYNIWKEMSLNDSYSDEEQAKFAVWDYPISDKYTKIWNQIQQVGLPATIDAGVERVKSSSLDDGFALLADANLVKYAVMTDCRLRAVGDEFSRKPIALALRKSADDAFLEELNYAILQLINQRFMEVLREKWWTNNPNKQACDKGEESEGISAQNFAGVFVIILAGLVLSFLVWTFERFVYETKKEISRRQALPGATR